MRDKGRFGLFRVIMVIMVIMVKVTQLVCHSDRREESKLLHKQDFCRNRKMARASILDSSLRSE